MFYQSEARLAPINELEPAALAGLLNLFSARNFHASAQSACQHILIRRSQPDMGHAHPPHRRRSAEILRAMRSRIRPKSWGVSSDFQIAHVLRGESSRKSGGSHAEVGSPHVRDFLNPSRLSAIRRKSEANSICKSSFHVHHRRWSDRLQPASILPQGAARLRSLSSENSHGAGSVRFPPSSAKITTLRISK